jgi:phosphate transport system substrate-binding protein
MIEISKIGVSTFLAVIGMIVLLIIGFASGYYYYTSTSQSGSSQEFPEDSAWRTGRLDVAGSTTVQPIANACALEFMNIYNQTDIRVSGGGSGQGYSQAIEGVIGLGMGSRQPKLTEVENARNKDLALWLHPIGLDAVCVVVNPSVNTTLKLTLEEVALIYAGTHTHWDDVHPDLPHEEIKVYVRAEANSGTRLTFEEYTIDEYGYSLIDNPLEAGGNPAMQSAIESNPWSIGYVGMGFLSDDIVTVALSEDGDQYFYPTLENILDNKYPISRALYFITTSRPASGSLTNRFIEFVLSTQGQNIVEQQGFIRIPETSNAAIVFG